MLRVEGLTKRFGGLVAVNDVSFEVPAGQVMLDRRTRTGAGKTTVFNLITGVLPADRGEVFPERQAHHRLAAAQVGRARHRAERSRTSACSSISMRSRTS